MVIMIPRTFLFLICLVVLSKNSCAARGYHARPREYAWPNDHVQPIGTEPYNFEQDYSPYIGQMFSVFSPGSGTLISPRVVVTAGHVLWDPKAGWATGALFSCERGAGRPSSLYIIGGYQAFKTLPSEEPLPSLDPPFSKWVDNSVGADVALATFTNVVYTPNPSDPSYEYRFFNLGYVDRQNTTRDAIGNFLGFSKARFEKGWWKGMAGYPGSSTTLQLTVSTRAFKPQSSAVIEVKGNLWRGMSGGPLFAYWELPKGTYSPYNAEQPPNPLGVSLVGVICRGEFEDDAMTIPSGTGYIRTFDKSFRKFLKKVSPRE